MKLTAVYLIMLPWLIGCKVSFRPATQPPGFNIEPSTKSFVIIDGGITNTPGLAIKKKRESVVKEVKNQYLIMLSNTLQNRLHLNNLTDTTLSDEEKNKLLNKDAVAIANISNKYSTAIVLILKDCYSGFRKGDVTEVSGLDGKSKIAEYDVFFDTDWIILQGNMVNEKTVTASKYHSNRSIQSGLLARGPGFEANKKDIMEMAERNAFNVALLFKY